MVTVRKRKKFKVPPPLILPPRLNTVMTPGSAASSRSTLCSCCFAFFELDDGLYFELHLEVRIELCFESCSDWSLKLYFEFDLDLHVELHFDVYIELYCEIHVELCFELHDVDSYFELHLDAY